MQPKGATFGQVAPSKHPFVLYGNSRNQTKTGLASHHSKGATAAPKLSTDSIRESKEPLDGAALDILDLPKMLVKEAYEISFFHWWQPLAPHV